MKSKLIYERMKNYEKKYYNKLIVTLIFIPHTSRSILVSDRYNDNNRM